MPKIKVDMPLDVRKYVLRFQAELKIKRETKELSQQFAIYTIIREHKQMKESKKDKQ